MMNKSEKIKNISAACKITDKVFVKLVRELKKNSFKTEQDIYNFLQKETKANKVRFSFKPVIAIGKNAFDIHHFPDTSKLIKGFLMIDYGVRYKGFASDCSRTFYLGKPSKYDKYLYNLVLMAQETALNHAQPGVHAADIDLIARSVLQKYYKNFVHAAGHGVGKRIHEYPRVSPKSNSILKKDRVITVEPGLYFKNKLGIRIEDTIVVRDKPIILTKFTKELIII